MPEALPRSGSIDGRRLFKFCIHSGKADTGCFDIERGGDKSLGHDDGNLSECDLDAPVGQPTADHPLSAESDQQGDAGHGRRKHNGQVDKGVDCPSHREPPPGQDIGHRCAKNDCQQGRDRGRFQANGYGQSKLGLSQILDKLPWGDTKQQGEQGDSQEQQER